MHENTSLIMTLIGETNSCPSSDSMLLNGNHTSERCSHKSSYLLVDVFKLRMIGSFIAILLCLLEILFCQTVTTGSPVPGSSGITFVDWAPNGEFDHSKPLTGKKPYSEDPEIVALDITCNEKGYKRYLRKWKAQKSYWNDYRGEEYKKRLLYFKESCRLIHYTNALKGVKLEFTFYADWDRSEFESIVQSQVSYSGQPLYFYDVDTGNKNANYRYLMPSMDPCEMEPSLRPAVSKPTNISVSWAFAVTNSIEYAIKKKYLEEYKQIVEVSLSAQELIDCVGQYQDADTIDYGGVSLQDAFDYVMAHGIAFSAYYPYTHSQGRCKTIPSEHKFHLSSYEKVEVPNKLGLFKLMEDGPVAVLMGLDPKYLQYYRSDSNKGAYLNTNFGMPTIYGVLVEYYQYAVEGSAEHALNPYFAVETRLRGCDSFVFRLPILESTEDSNIGGIAGYAIRPIIDAVTTVLPPTVAPTAPIQPTTPLPTTTVPTTPMPTTPLPTTALPTPARLPTSTPTPTPSPTPTLEPWFPVYDPFILGDNCYYEVQSTCLENIIPDIEVFKKYLAVRDAYPTKALKHTRVLALSGMNLPAVNLLLDSLSHQEKNPANIDMYFYSERRNNRVVDSNIAVSLISLSQYTYPRIILFGDGSIKREGMANILQWMIDNKDKGYFRNLESLQITDHNMAAYSCSDEEAAALQTQIVNNLQAMCSDNSNFPLLNSLNFNNNGYDQYSDFATAIKNACGKVSADEQGTLYYSPLCSDQRSSLWYYNLWDEEETAQCRFTWNWEMDDLNTVYAPQGPFPNSNTVNC